MEEIDIQDYIDFIQGTNSKQIASGMKERSNSVIMIEESPE